MKIKAATLLGASVLGLAACSGGSDSGAGTATLPTPTTSAVGVLVDSPVAGVAYATSGGFSGFTDADGKYNYNPGETVTFKIGAITLGTVSATGTVTPIQLAGTGGTSANMVTNLLVLLQSLDADNNPSNGITINAATRTAAASASSLDLTQSPTTFASSGNTVLMGVISGSGLSLTAPVTPDDALAHFKDQFLNEIKGAWTVTTANGRVIVFRFDAAGNYIMGEAGTVDQDGRPGAELGQINWDPVDGSFTKTVSFDSNGQWGLSHPTGVAKLRVDGAKLIHSDDQGSVAFTQIGRDADRPLVGTWVINDAGTTFPGFGRQTFTFFANGKYLMADPVGDTLASGAPCSAGGLEYGNYSFNAATGVLEVNAVPEIDTNDCAGLWDKPRNQGATLTLTFNQDKTVFTFADSVTMSGHRVSK